MNVDDLHAKRVARAELVTRTFVVVTALALIAILGLGTSLLVKVSHVTDTIRATQKTNTSVNHTNTQLLQLIHSCLTPTGSCYKLGQEQRAASAKGTQQTAAAASACAASLAHPTYLAVYRCVRASVAQGGQQ